MYDKLVKQCRDCIDCLCGECKYEHLQKPGNFVPCMNALLGEAADAIEELSKLADAIPHVCECCVGCELEKKNGGCDNAFVLSPKRAMQYLIKPRWIPVTERLPEPFENILVANKRGKHYDIDKGWWNGTFFDRCAKGGYHNVTHWMPLPQPPKEE